MNKFVLILFLYFNSLPTLFSQELHFFSNITIKGNPYATAITQTRDGNYLIASWVDHVNGIPCSNLAKIDNAGNLVSSFKQIMVDDHIIKIDTTTDGKILIGGWFKNVNGVQTSIMRLNNDGTLDDTFITFPVPSEYEYVSTFDVQSNGKILVAGSFHISGFNDLIRLNTDGSIDLSFQSNAVPFGYVSRVLVDQADNIYASNGSSVFKLNANGILQTGFPLTVNSSGHFFNLKLYGEKIIIAGTFTSIGNTDRKNIAVIDDDGTVNAFTVPNATDEIQDLVVTNSGGLVVTNLNSTIMYDVNGVETHRKNSNNPVRIFLDDRQRLLVLSRVTSGVESTSDPRLTRYTSAYEVDNSFICRPTYTSGITAITSNFDGRILIGMDNLTSGVNLSNKKLARINPDGTIDNTFQPNLPTSYEPIRSLATQPDGKILAATNRLSRLLPSGAKDVAFKEIEVNSPNGTVLGKVKVRNEKIYLGGSFTQVESHKSPGIIRVDSNGITDKTFASALPETSYVTDFSFQENNKIVVTGNFNFNGDIKSVIRLNENGTIDDSFTKGYHTYNGIWRIAIDSLDKIYISGNFTDYNGTALDRLARLSPEGVLDMTFTPTLPFEINSSIEGLELLSNNEILLGARVGYDGSRALLLLDEKGNTLDRSFAQIGKQSSISTSYFNGETLYLAGRVVSQDQTHVSGFAFMGLKSIAGKVINLQAERETGTIANLQWSSEISQGTLLIIERSENDNTSFAPIDTISLLATSYKNTGLVHTKAYYYRIRGINTNSSTEYSNEAFADPSNITSAETVDYNTIYVYPNPGSDWFTISMPSFFSGGKYSVLGSDGTLKYQSSIFLTEGKMNLNLTEFKSGLYIIKIENEKNRAYLKVIKL